MAGNLQNDEQLSEGEVRARAIVSSALDAIITIDRENRITEFNPSAERLFRWVRADVIGRDVGEVLIPDALRERHRRGLTHHLATGEITVMGRRIELEAMRADGSQIPIELTVTRFGTEERPVFTAFIRDMTQHKLMASQLELQAVRLNAIVRAQHLLAASDADPDQLMDQVAEMAQGVLSSDGAVLELREGDALVYRSVSGAAAGQLGRRLRLDASLSGLALSQDRVLWSNDCDADPRVDAIACRAVGVKSMIVAVLHAAGKPIGIIKAISRQPNCFTETDANVLDLFASSVGAVLHRKHAEIDRLQIADQLRQSQRLESIGQLTGGVAHDFNNLLTVILGNGDLLAEQLTDSRLGGAAEMIVGAAQRGADLTHRLLAFARRQPLEPKPVDVSRLMAGMEPLLHRTLGEHIEIEMIRDENLWSAMVDATQLEGALLNLCLNSRDAMPAGGHLTIEIANTELDRDYVDSSTDLQPGQYVMVAVSDTGMGISQDIIERVFEPFFTTKEPGKGTGLGLAMLYGFIKQSEGHVSIYSEPNEGTTIRMYLPRAAEHDVPEEMATSLIDAPGGTEKVLLVEDDVLVLKYATDQLESLGYEVRSFGSAWKALELLRTDAPVDLLFTDVVMPGMNGKTLVDEALKIRPDLKVLFASGYAENAIVHQGRLDPGVNLLSKPYRRNDLAKKIREVVDDVSSPAR